MFGSIVKAVAGPIVGGLFGQKGQEDANAASAESVQKQMDFQERMSNTSYQRAMEDMKKAGLNPMLAYMHGGASVPSGSVYQAQNESEVLGKGMSNVNLNQAEMLEASTAKTTADTQLSAAQADLASAEAAEVRARTPTHAANIEHINESTRKMGYEIANVLSSTHLSNAQTEKVWQEISNLKLVPDLTIAQTKHALAQAGLSSAQIAEIAPRIQNTIASTARIRAGLGFEHMKSFIGDAFSELKDVPSDSSLGRDYAAEIKNSAKSIVDFFKPSNRRYKGDYKNTD